MKGLRAVLILSITLALVVTVALVGNAKAHASACQTVLVEENSGNGPTYPLKVCAGSGSAAFTSPGKGKEWVLIVDGGPLPEKSTKTATIVLAEVKS